GRPLSAAAPEPVTATAEVADLSSVVPWSTVTVGFSRPMNPATVVRALRVNPATVVRTGWHGNRLLVRAVHGFTPNSPYILTISRSVARTASGTSLTADLNVIFGTAQAAPLPASSRPPTALPLATVASAEEGSRAVVTMTGAVVVTAGRVQWGAQTFSGLISFRGA